MRDASVTLTWADGTYDFRLAWGEIEALQEACDAGPWVILDRLSSRQCLIGDISHTIRQGLIGGGMTPADATKLVQRYVEKRPPAESLIFAIGILQVALHGSPDETVGEPVAGSQNGSQTTISPTEK